MSGRAARLHVDTYGRGPTALFVHGICSWGLDTFPDQRDLANAYRVLLIDRVGFGQTPRGAQRLVGWPVDGDALIELLESEGPAHVVGHSYGAVVALLAAGLRPDLVRSLVLIEPLLFDVVADRPAVRSLIAALRAVYVGAPAMSAGSFWTAFRAATGARPQSVAEVEAHMTEADWRAVDNSRFEAWAGDAPIDYGRIAAASWSKLHVLGTAPVSPSREPMRFAFRETAHEVADRIGGPVVEFVGSGHSPQEDDASRFNGLLRELWSEG
jgi:pimeloyl-ACP methyl ester carboxylesterase